MSITVTIMKALNVPMDEYVRPCVFGTYHEYSYDEDHRRYYEGAKYSNGWVCETCVYFVLPNKLEPDVTDDQQDHVENRRHLKIYVLNWLLFDVHL